VLGILGPACIALALGVASFETRQDAAQQSSTDGTSGGKEQVVCDITPADDSSPKDSSPQDSSDERAPVDPNIIGSQPPIRQYALLELGESLLNSGRFPEAEAQLRSFIASHPKTPRLPRAYHSLSLALQRQGRAQEALKLYRAAIEDLGDDPTNRAVESILLACAKLHKAPADRIALERDLSALCSRACSAGRRTLAARCAWLLARFAKRSHPESTHQTFLGLARDIPAELLPPTIAIDIAEHLIAADCRAEAEPLLRHLACHDDTPQGRRALAALGLIAAERGDSDEALAIFETFEKEDNVKSALLPNILECHARILITQARHPEAIAVLEMLLKSPKTKGPTAARALCSIGECHEALGQPEKAMPYYQRVHAMYGDQRDAAATAYFASGRIFEKLHLWESARATYEEFLQRDDLAGREESALARERLQSIP